MANRVNVDLDINAQGYIQGVNQATESAKAYETETRKIADAQVNLTKETKRLRKEAENLAAGYAQLTAAEKQSAFGKEMARQLNEASEKASSFINLQGDIKDGLKSLASETTSLDMLSTGIGALGGAASSAAGLVALFTGNEKDAQRAVVMFTTAQSALNTIISTYNAIKKIQNVLLVKGTTYTTADTVAQNLNTAAKTKNTIATTSATTAQKLFNTVAKANPYVLAGTAILAVASALLIFSKNTKKAKDETKELTIAEKNAKEVSEAYASTLSSEYSKLMTSYTKLKAEWASLSNNNDRKAWIKAHKSELKSLGAEINNVQDAEGFFKSNTASVVQGFIKRARAAALAAQAAKLYAQQIEIIENNNKWLEEKGFKEGDVVKGGSVFKMDASTKYSNNPTYNNGQYYMDNGVYKYTEAGAEAANKNTEAWKKNNEAYKENVNQQQKIEHELTNIISELGTLTGSVGSSTSTDKENIKTISDAISKYDQLGESIKKLETSIKENRFDEEGKKKAEALVESMKNEQDKLAKTWGIFPAKEKVDQKKVDKWANSLYNTLSKELKDIEERLQNDDSLSLEGKIVLMEKANDIQERLNNMSNTNQFTIPATIEPKFVMKGSNQDFRQSVQNARAQINQIMDDYDMGLIESSKDAKAKIDEINQKLIEMGAEPIIIEFETKGMKDFQSFLDGYDQFNGIVNDIDGCVNAFTRLNDVMKESDNIWEQFMAIMQAVTSVINITESVVRAFDAVSTALNVTTTSTNSLKAAEATERTANATAMGAESVTLGTLAGTETAAIAPTIALATATKKLAGANIWLAHSSIPFAGPIAAGTAVTAMETSLLSLSAFKYGGIVGGNSFSGDRVLVRVNSGEMILTQQQQKTLFDAIDQNKIGNSIVVTGDVKVKGTDLYIALRNLDGVTKKLR